MQSLLQKRFIQYHNMIVLAHDHQNVYVDVPIDRQVFLKQAYRIAFEEMRQFFNDDMLLPELKNWTESGNDKVDLEHYYDYVTDMIVILVERFPDEAIASLVPLIGEIIVEYFIITKNQSNIPINQTSSSVPFNRFY
jgi:hypothetical protein